MVKNSGSSGDDSLTADPGNSVLASLTNISLQHPAKLGLIGSVIWSVLMLFYIVNDLLVEPINLYPILVVTDILNIVGAILLFMFIRFLYNQGVHFGSRKLIFMIMVGFGLRVIGNLFDTINYFLIEYGVADVALLSLLFIFSDLFHLLGALAIAAIMLLLFRKEHKRIYKVTCFLSIISALLYGIVHIYLFLLDAGIINGVYIQIIRLVSLLTSITLILYFSLLLKDSIKGQREKKTP